jgi:hypothetical protein
MGCSGRHLRAQVCTATVVCSMCPALKAETREPNHWPLLHQCTPVVANAHPEPSTSIDQSQSHYPLCRSFQNSCRCAIFWSSALTAACGLASALVPTYWWLVAARALSGFTLSAAPAAFTWMLEVSHS